MSDRPLISVVSPMYFGEKFIDDLTRRLVLVLSKITDNYEIILIDDGSSDNTWARILKKNKENSKIHGLRLSRNFGQHYGITAGLDYARGEWIVVMDCDLQEPPEEIVKFYEKAKEGYDVILGRRFLRKDNFFRKISSKLFNYIFNFLSDIQRDPAVAFFVMMNRKVKDALCEMREHARFVPSMLDWTGFHKIYIPVAHEERSFGKSTYTLRKLVHLAFDAIISNSNKPLRLIIIFGMFISFVSFCTVMLLLILYFYRGYAITGWASLIISIWFLSGILMMFLGLLGVYIGRIYDEVKGRPLYVIRDKTLH